MVTLYQQLQEPALVRGLAHPLRARMFSVLLEREASPKELADEFDVPLANVAYHMQVLRKLELIRLVRKTPRRGAVEHHYRADRAPHISNAAWGETPGVVKKTMVAAALEDVGRDVGAAAATGGFERDDVRLSRSHLVLDQRAWDELGKLLEHALARGDELEKEAAARLAKSDREGERRAGVVMMLYDSPPSDAGTDAVGVTRQSKRASARRNGSGP